ncbi:hypothetical protein FKOIJHOC_00160 [Acinetobacter phage Ab_121]|nr:hypothetical protein FKOIJHOC_00160 [Acinetobacter phage Ab_121]UYL86125.1 hypothetical protein [Acinetobacter phage vB_AbaM_CP14]
MTIVLIQIILALFAAVNFYCEVSKKYRDCGIHASLRWLFMVTSLIALAKVKYLAVMPFVVQLSALIIVIGLTKLLYDHVLKRQIRIANFKLKKLYLEEVQKHSHR